MLPKISTRRNLSSRSSTSSDSSGFSPTNSFHSFLDSPPLSPTLPSIIPRHGKKPPPRRLRALLRLLKRALPWIFGVTAAVWLLWTITCSAQVRFHMRNSSPANRSSRVINADELPDGPTPVMLVDVRGRTKWTVHIPENLEFPLAPHVYAELCASTDDIAAQVSECKDRPRSKARKACASYYHVDKSFLDVQEAQDRGLIPKSKEGLGGQVVGVTEGRYSKSEDRNQTTDNDTGAVCGRSLTYVLESDDPGLGNTLMGLWMAYGLALKENRAFFIDDSRWAYGEYTTYFQPPPLPACHPPRYTHRLPCPHHARHLLVSSATFSHTFSPAFSASYPQRETFALLRAGYEALFHLAAPDAHYLSKRLSALAEIRAKGGSVVGVHVRHGDQHPLEYQYQQSYTPLGRYVDAARDMMKDLGLATATRGNRTRDPAGKETNPGRIVLASDDPDVYTADDLAGALPAQDHIVMASKKQLDDAQKTLRSPSVYRKFTDDNLGWEGGFFRRVFWGLGSPARSARRSLQVPATAAAAVLQGYAPPGALALQLRGLIARAYLLDVSVLGAADGVVCGGASATCRVLAVMMGWEEAMGRRRWRNVDGGFAWRGLQLGRGEGS